MITIGDHIYGWKLEWLDGKFMAFAYIVSI